MKAIKYPRRRVIRGFLRGITWALASALTRLEIYGKENLPPDGPLLVTINHFSFADPALILRIVPYPIEVLGGFRTPAAPGWGAWILKLWGYLPVFRGTGARRALRVAEHILAQGGVLGIAPEGGAWATVLRPPRPGAAFLAARSEAPVLPIGLEGTYNIFPPWRGGRRARVVARIGEPIGPFKTTQHGRARRAELDAIGHEIMKHIAALIPPARRGIYSDDPAIRATAQSAAAYPWEDKIER
ncbi:MAG: lysophospholipid acyltransferase family protein [Anaerolineae bacterium]